MFGTVLTIFTSFFLAGGCIKDGMKTSSRREDASQNNKDFYFDSKNVCRSVVTNEPVYNAFIGKEKLEVKGVKTGNVYKTVDNEKSRYSKQESNYDSINNLLNGKGQMFYWRHNKNWDYVNRQCKNVMVWGQVDLHNGKYIKNIVPVSGGYDIIYADDNFFGVRINDNNEIDHRVISCDEYKSHYYMFKKQRLI